MKHTTKKENRREIPGYRMTAKECERDSNQLGCLFNMPFVTHALDDLPFRTAYGSVDLFGKVNRGKDIFLTGYHERG
jgi:hypothetical protein